MATFSTAPRQEVMTTSRPKPPSRLVTMRQEFDEAVRDALVEHQGTALVVQLLPDEKPLTQRNRLKASISRLNLKGITIKRRGTVILAYRASDLDQESFSRTRSQT